MTAIPPLPPLRPIFNATDWYWTVDGDQARVYSSRVGDFVPVNDPAYKAWKASGNEPVATSRADLGQFLAQANLRPNDATVLPSYQAALADDLGKRAQIRIMFNHENRIRVLENRAQITMQQFIAAIRSLM